MGGACGSTQAAVDARRESVVTVEPKDEPPPSAELVKVCDEATFPDNSSRVLRVKGHDIAVYRKRGMFYALDNACYHHGAPLQNGDIEDVSGKLCVVCPWHGYRIALETGEGLYWGLGEDLSRKELRSKGIKQRAHRVLVSDGEVMLEPNLGGSIASDFYCGVSATGFGDTGGVHSTSPKPKYSPLVLKARQPVCPSGRMVQFTFRSDRDVKVTPGQYIDFVIDTGMGKATRSWTVIDKSDGNSISIAVKRKDDGQISPWMLDHLKVGQALQITRISGSFGFLVTPPPLKKVLMVCAGAGITPMYAMLKGLWLDKKVEDVILLYGERHEEDIAFRDEFTAPGVEIAVHLALTQPPKGWKQYRGRINISMIQRVAQDLRSRVIYLCGPGDFNQSLIEALVAKKVDRSLILTEVFF